ncbi:pentatricopeptide repeat-containing protein At3g16610-like [Phoenix dactylifera]|uniref:Pentatricopeptide repeat-containing protein At3g16610-like n=1 Tax=Phoenix dactylifera TaxID=42345 RepID=A0A8B7MW51_PHODC|nr:pentatricopeptide repeat-containing protein At3g16610-like [Phoenix dactylifera]XP_017700641.2 pentatricopeptide repeat-containing protein At3g16610-like [Phoenix dactylifera]XP_017700644.2 pentatricopeptide repeat-containing protein At3g16610-like [Phoenix dactylifera]XP_017700646.2 pentatricopeptide repeat-containing protein At3g16610-like [Phoenix dactylifera]XP_026664765.1 pentatricopeptide repeat-containing protein At3g16610-like [Phoenix dactylifera]XP_026664768.1 pentatricopeptide re
MMSSILTNSQSLPLPSQKAQTKHQKAWNSILKYHLKLKNDRGILATFAEMVASGVAPDRLTLPFVLKACARLHDVKLGQRIYSDISGTNLIDDVRIRTALIDFYCKCGLVDDAFELFEEMTQGDLASWNAMISGTVKNFQYKDSILLFSRMRRAGFDPNSVTLVSLLSACSKLSDLRLGKEIHSYCLRRGFLESDPHIGTSLIGFYSGFDIRWSRSVFDTMVLRNTVSWNAIIYGYFQVGGVDEALEFFVQMLVDNVSPDSVTFLAALQCCAEFGCLELGKQIHQFVVKYGFLSNKFVANALIDMYGKSANSELSSLVFEKMLIKDLAAWNAMISAYKNCMLYDKAFNLFKKLQLEDIEENSITIATMLSICAQSGELEKGKQLHAYALKTGKKGDVTIESALLSMYAELDCMVSSLQIFHGMDKLDVVFWNILFAGLIRNQLTSQAWSLFRQMQQIGTKPNSFTMVSLLAGCKDKLSLNIGRSIHGYVTRHGLGGNSSLCTALTNVYMDCGYESAALHIFWSSSDRDVVSWNAMIACYIRNGKPNEALLLFYLMHSEVKPNSATLINVLPSCTHMANPPQGRCLHAYIVRRELGLALDSPLGNALLTMYARCGSISNAEKVFKNLPGRDIVSWNAMIAAYGIHGCGEDAVHTFYQMLDAGERPTSVTFISVLSACSHSGLVEKGWEVFHSMTRDFNITPKVVHYSCMVDLLGRAGSLDKASDLIHSMPMEPDPSVWRALLSACQVFSNIELAKIIAGKLFELEPWNIANYILLSNIYAAAGNWEDVKALRALIKEKGFRKTPGNSWTATRNQVNSFTAGDKLHPQLSVSYTRLKWLLDGLNKDDIFLNQVWSCMMWRMRKEG